LAKISGELEEREGFSSLVRTAARESRELTTQDIHPLGFEQIQIQHEPSFLVLLERKIGEEISERVEVEEEGAEVWFDGEMGRGDHDGLEEDREEVFFEGLRERKGEERA